MLDSVTLVTLEPGLPPSALLLIVTAPPDAAVLYNGQVYIRYAARLLGKGELSIVPGLVAVDYGMMLTDQAAWEFLVKRSNLYPRADVIGYRSDGRDEMVTVKSLDLAQPIDVLVYVNTVDTLPIARVSAVIAPSDFPLPSYLNEYLPRYAAMQAWQEANEHAG